MTEKRSRGQGGRCIVIQSLRSRRRDLRKCMQSLSSRACEAGVGICGNVCLHCHYEALGRDNLRRSFGQISHCVRDDKESVRDDKKAFEGNGKAFERAKQALGGQKKKPSRGQGVREGNMRYYIPT